MNFCISFLLSLAAVLNAQEQFQYLYPIPGSSLISKQTTIILRPGEPVLSTEQELSSLFSIIGSASGTHTGRVIISDDQKTILWKPALEFVPSETVFVRIQTGITTTASRMYSPLTYYFVISPRSDEHPISTKSFQGYKSPTVKNSSNISVHSNAQDSVTISLPSDFPRVKINVSNRPDTGYLFLSNMWNGNPYLAIYDNAGTPVFYRKIPGNAYDFKVQPTGKFSYYIQSDINRFYILDSTYTLIDSIVSVQGYTPNEHELRILPNGHMLLIGSEVQTVDMSKYVVGGNPQARVLGNHVLELDAAKNVVFVWRCWDHYKITDCIDADLTSASFDYVHMNAIDIDTDGNLLVSCRNMSEITKINRSTGSIMWRLGGKNNQFTFSRDPNTFTYLNKPLSFSYQHYIRATSNGRYMLFDNGNLRSNKFSRAVEYYIDTVTKSAEMVWQYRNTPDFYSGWMGSAQRLPSGTTLINWADPSAPKATEVGQDGTKLFEMDFLTPAVSYRANRSIWKGKANAPYLVVEPHNNRISLFYNIFGDSDVVQFKVYAGSSPKPVTLIATTEQPSLELTGLENGKRYYFRVTAVNSKGLESAYSNEESELIKYFAPGENLLLNGSFSEGLTNWQLDNYDSADSKSAVLPTGECFLFIKRGGPNIWSVQFLQANLEIIYGKKYVFEFDAYASAQRTIDVKVEMNGSPWTNYSRTSIIVLPTVKKHFSFPFTMQQPTDYRARVSFNCGVSNAFVFLDNIALTEMVPVGAGDFSVSVPFQNSLEDCFPNPFNPSTTIEYSVARQSHVTITVSDLLGREVAVLADDNRSAGRYSVQWDASNKSSGMYFYTLQSGNYRLTKRMILMK